MTSAWLYQQYVVLLISSIDLNLPTRSENVRPQLDEINSTMSRGLSRICILSSPTSHPSFYEKLQRSTRRAFHATSPPRFLDVCCEQTYAILNSLHTLTGLPWAVTLPLAGVGVRILLVGPFSIISHDVTRRRLSLQPLRHAWSHHLRKKIFQKYAALGPKVCHRALSRALVQNSREIDTRMGTQRWKEFIPLAQVPVFLLVIETIRKMSGVHDGLLGLLSKAFTRANSGDEFPGQELMQDSAVPMVHSLAEEGALWFTNLLVPDPFSVLPLLLSGTILLNIFLQRRQASEPSKWGRRYLNAITALGFMVGPLTLQLPAAMHVYWLSTSTFAIGQTLFLQKYRPRPRPVKPCPERHNREMLGSAKPSEDTKGSRIKQ